MSYKGYSKYPDLKTKVLAFLDRPSSGCWEWKGMLDYKGYGRVPWRGKNLLAHRASYVAHRGEIPGGLPLDHLCRNRKCVNPAHLEAVTNTVNILRGVGAPALNARKVECAYGHAFSKENTFIRTKNGRPGRECRTCKAIKKREYIDRHRDRINAERRANRPSRAKRITGGTDGK